MTPRYAYCKLKNVAVVIEVISGKPPFYIDLVNHLPNDCIRMRTGGWCAVCNECGWDSW